MPEILAIGEPMVEFNQSGGPGSRNYLQGYGGDTSNFAIAAARQGARSAYFTRLGAAYPRKWSEQRLAVMRANLAGDIPDGMMMRVSALGIDQDEAQALLGDFSRQFIESANPRLQRLLLGADSEGIDL